MLRVTSGAALGVKVFPGSHMGRTLGPCTRHSIRGGQSTDHCNGALNAKKYGPMLGWQFGLSAVWIEPLLHLWALLCYFAILLKPPFCCTGYALLVKAQSQQVCSGI